MKDGNGSLIVAGPRVQMDPGRDKARARGSERVPGRLHKAGGERPESPAELARLEGGGRKIGPARLDYRLAGEPARARNAF